MAIEQLVLLASLFFLAAAIYSTVGHAGASGYLAIMALVGVAPATMRPTALVLNLMVAALGTYQFWRAKLIDWRTLLPFALASTPLAFIGGRIQLPVPDYRLLVGIVLLVSAVVITGRAFIKADAAKEPVPNVPLATSIVVGAVIGLVAGLTGTGGGIFLSPVLLLMGWAGPRRTAGLAAPFILINSLGGLLGLSSVASRLPPGIIWLAAAVLLGGLVGTTLGINRLPPRVLLVVLSFVLVIAGGKFMLPV